MKILRSGFTLVELLITVAVVAIVLALAAPTLREVILNNQRSTQLNAIMSSLNVARAAAVQRGVNAIVCITDGATPPDCDTSATTWEDGWIVFADNNGNGAYDNASEDLIQAHAPLEDGATLRGDSAEVTRAITFNARGFCASCAEGTEGVLQLCDPRAEAEARGVSISRTGRAQVIDGVDCP
jgi:type IV fimbrial biogenesis protein FimT